MNLPVRQRPYSVENSRSHSNSEDKPPKARSVLGWGTAREALGCCWLFLLNWWPPVQALRTVVCREMARAAPRTLAVAPRILVS